MYLIYVCIVIIIKVYVSVQIDNVNLLGENAFKNDLDMICMMK